MNDWTYFTELAIEPKRGGRGWALYARCHFAAGAILARVGIGELTRVRSLRTIELEENLHEDHPQLRYMNHSCDPNTVIDKENRVLRALRPLEPFEEVTFDYLVNESEIAAPFDCECGARNCRGRIERSTRRWVAPSAESEQGYVLVGADAEVG